MEQIIVRHPDGTTALLTSRARKSGVTKAEQSITLLGADTVAITVKSATPLTFHLGDQIDVYGKTYTLNQLPGIKKTGNRNFEYTLTFEGVDVYKRQEQERPATVHLRRINGKHRIKSP